MLRESVAVVIAAAAASAPDPVAAELRAARQVGRLELAVYLPAGAQSEPRASAKDAEALGAAELAHRERLLPRSAAILERLRGSELAVGAAVAVSRASPKSLPRPVVVVGPAALLQAARAEAESDSAASPFPREAAAVDPWAEAEQAAMEQPAPASAEAVGPESQ